MTGFFMFLHAMICILLGLVILMQSGRGGGLTEGFASAESLFGAQTNKMMIKATTIVASLFFATCLGIALLSVRTGKSLMANKVLTQAESPKSAVEIPLKEEVTEAVDDIIPVSPVEPQFDL